MVSKYRGLGDKVSLQQLSCSRTAALPQIIPGSVSQHCSSEGCKPTDEPKSPACKWLAWLDELWPEGRKLTVSDKEEEKLSRKVGL